MTKRKSVNGLIVLSLLLVLILSAFSTFQAAETADGPIRLGKHVQRLATASVTARAARMENQPKRLIVQARRNHFIVDSIPPLGGTNEELNPVDLLASALAACATFVSDRAAREKGIELEGITTTAEGEFDARGLLGFDFDPRFQVFRVHMDLDGATEEQQAQLEEAFKARCLVYATLIRSVDTIEITTNDEQPSPPLTGPGIMTASAVAQLSNERGRAIVSVQGGVKDFIADAEWLLGGPNHELNSIDMTLSALATCATILYEDEAIKQGVPLTAIAAKVEADYDRRGMKSAQFDARIQAFRVTVDLEGPTPEQAEALQAKYVLRCPLYTTLVRAAPIEIVNVTH
jgi:uncharacterized OsmC-like protein